MKCVLNITELNIFTYIEEKFASTLSQLSWEELQTHGGKLPQDEEHTSTHAR